MKDLSSVLHVLFHVEGQLKRITPSTIPGDKHWDLKSLKISRFDASLCLNSTAKFVGRKAKGRYL